MKNNKNFDNAVTTIRTALRRRATSQGTVSSVDAVGVAPKFRGPARGAAIRAAFTQLIREGFVKPTKDSVYNSTSRHSVVVYRTQKNSK